MRLGTDRNLRWITFITLLGFLSPGLYLFLSNQNYGLGYPLDDAWIHQTYARNLIQYGEWSFIPGIPSAGSTSPLWTIIIALGLLIGLDPQFWTYLSGAILLVLLGWIGWKWFSLRWGGIPNWGWLIGAALVFEWHLIWAALSGMETLAFATLCMAVFLFLDKSDLRPFELGLLIGLGVWIRPGALTLAIPSLLVLIAAKQIKQIKAFMLMTLGAALLVGPYLIFNYLLTDSIWPNTFYAKQAEYAILNQSPLLVRFAKQLFQPLVGVGVLLLPGIIYGTIHSLRKLQWSRLAGLIWVFIYLGMYALRLPVTYQHGRYAIPTIPVILVLGFEGISRWVKLESPKTSVRLLSRLWVFSSLAVLIAFVFVGGQAYSQDVAIIETEMVFAAKWIADNTEEDTLIAAHDIGALGYFGDRELVDLAGLISPEVIPFIRDEEMIAVYLDQRDADYLMTFPDWYPNLVRELEVLFSTNGEFSPQAGGENIVVYRWGY